MSIDEQATDGPLFRRPNSGSGNLLLFVFADDSRPTAEATRLQSSRSGNDVSADEHDANATSDSSHYAEFNAGTGEFRATGVDLR